MDETADTSPRPFRDELARLRAALVKAVRRACPAWLGDSADDLVQIALERVHKLIREGNAQVSASYLRKVAYSVVVDEIRKRRRRNEVSIDPDDDGQGPASELPAGAPDPENLARGREIGSAIRDCLGRLVGPRRSAVTLHLLGHTVPEIGRLLGWEGKRADNLVYRGMADLRECLESKGVRP